MYVLYILYLILKNNSNNGLTNGNLHYIRFDSKTKQGHIQEISSIYYDNIRLAFLFVFSSTFFKENNNK